jgi:LytS/YehU family sensor histidine kinase
MAKQPNSSARYKSLATAGLANLYQKNGNYAQARQYYDEGLAQAEEYSNVYIQARIYRDLAGLFRTMNKPDSCVYFAQRGLDLCKQYNFGDYASRIAQILSGLYESQHQLDSAVKYLKLNIAARDSIFSQTNIQQFQYLILQDQQKQQEAILTKERLIRNAATIFLIVVLLISVLTILNIRLKRRNERLKNQNLLSELEQRTSEMEMQALRAQMNPHFIFNCLNSINMFIVKNESVAASDYLTQFSRLIRLVLNNSKKAWITLDEELEMLRLYLDMEKLRFKEAFDYVLDVKAIADVFNVFIPPLLLQPFIENAIWHGLMHKKNHGTVVIRFREEQDILYCTIVDDGVGRSAAAKLGSKSSQSHKSLGIKIATDRLTLINENIENDIVSFEIEDLYNEKKEAAGTKVSLRIKFQ